MAQHLIPAAVGPSFFTPDQSAWRAQAQGYDADMGYVPGNGAPGVLHKITYNPDDGSAETSTLDPTGDGWVDLGGAPGRVTRAGR